MFDFFKKKNSGQPGIAKENTSAALAGSNRKNGRELPEEKPIEVDKIAIHVMPSRFRNQPIKKDSAKTIGLLIIVGGVIFLFIVSAGLYYFLFKKPSVTITEEPSLIVENNQTAEVSETEAEVNQTVVPVNTLTATEDQNLLIDDQTTATSTATTSSETIPTELDSNLSAGADDDNDGLTNIEEIIFSTDAAMFDSDGDGYSDGSELINLYNPFGEGKLITNPGIALYENKTFSYDILYPSIWQTNSNGGDDSLMFRTGDNQFIQVIVQPNINNQTLDQWYMEQLSLPAVNSADRVISSNWAGIKSLDGLNIYMMDKKQNYIFSLTYNPGGGSMLEYSNIFNMMVKSFNLKD